MGYAINPSVRFDTIASVAKVVSDRSVGKSLANLMGVSTVKAGQSSAARGPRPAARF